MNWLCINDATFRHYIMFIYRHAFAKYWRRNALHDGILSISTKLHFTYSLTYLFLLTLIQVTQKNGTFNSHATTCFKLLSFVVRGTARHAPWVHVKFLPPPMIYYFMLLGCNHFRTTFVRSSRTFHYNYAVICTFRPIFIFISLSRG